MEQNALEEIRQAKLVPVLRAANAGSALETAERLLGNGLSVIELTATTPGWQSALARLRAGHPQATLGVGTVVTAADATAAIDGGARFLVSPWPAAPVRDLAQARGIPFLEGGFTPAELAAATARGVAKLFPAHVGGVAYLKSLLAVLPGARIMPTGGIKLDEVAQWLAAGAFAVGVGSELANVPASRVREVLDGL
jgi:2-dehydro-3-deoxyphosphogluconate aldolase / (4S)-4-hydroxy-2-oxoglutarate aldolase